MDKTPYVITCTNAALILFSMAGDGFRTSRYSSVFTLVPCPTSPKIYTGTSNVTVPHFSIAWRCFCCSVCILPLPLQRLRAVLPAAFQLFTFSYLKEAALVLS